MVLTPMFFAARRNIRSIGKIISGVITRFGLYLSKIFKTSLFGLTSVRSKSLINFLKNFLFPEITVKKRREMNFEKFPARAYIWYCFCLTVPVSKKLKA